MKNSLSLLLAGFESSSGLTPEFQAFAKTFKKEFTKELQSIGATNVQFSRGHFYVSGFFTLDDKMFYFNLGDVRGMDYALKTNPDSCMSKLMYREVQHYKDYTGGMNRYVKIETGMALEMCWYFKII
jgi:hypothetical protein